jgi:hypothetical protein
LPPYVLHISNITLNKYIYKKPNKRGVTLCVTL